MVISNDRPSNTQGIEYFECGCVISSFRLYHFSVIFFHFFSRCGRPFALFCSKTSFRLSNKANSCKSAFDARVGVVLVEVVLFVVLVVVVVVVLVVVDVVVLVVVVGVVVLGSVG